MHLCVVHCEESADQRALTCDVTTTVCYLQTVFSDSSSPMALQPNFGLGLFNPPPPNISVIYRPSPILAFQHPLSIPFHCIYPSSSGSSNRFSPIYVSFQSFLGYPFVLHPHHVTHTLESSQSDILGQLRFLIQISWLYMFRRCPLSNTGPLNFLKSSKCIRHLFCCMCQCQRLAVLPQDGPY